MSQVNIQPAAQAEAGEAAAWYEAQQPGLGIEFLLQLDAAIETAAAAPLIYATVCHDVRRVLMRRFPYAVYFLYDPDAVEDTVEEFAVLHQQRATFMWRSRV